MKSHTADLERERNELLAKLIVAEQRVVELEEMNANQERWLEQAEQPEGDTDSVKMATLNAEMLASLVTREQPPMSRERLMQEIRLIQYRRYEILVSEVLDTCVCAETSSRNCPEHGEVE